jgi:sugar fermentation stimulation protein A
MKFPRELIAGVLIQRRKRFLADVRLDDGRVITAHTANTGSMRGCSDPGSRVWLLDTMKPGRKYRYSWELVEAVPGVLVGVNTHLANKLVREGVENDAICELQGYDDILSEVTVGSSRIDLVLEKPGGRRCLVEVKSVTLAEQGIAYFPDSPSVRGARHLEELARAAASGRRSAIFFCVQRGDVKEVRPADDIDPVFGHKLRRAIETGAEALAYRAAVTTGGISLAEPLPVLCP